MSSVSVYRLLATSSWIVTRGFANKAWFSSFIALEMRTENRLQHAYLTILHVILLLNFDCAGFLATLCCTLMVH